MVLYLIMGRAKTGPKTKGFVYMTLLIQYVMYTYTTSKVKIKTLGQRPRTVTLQCFLQCQFFLLLVNRNL